MAADMKKIEKIILDCSPQKALEIFFETKNVLKTTKIKKEASKLLSSSVIQMTPEHFDQHVRYQSTVQIKGLSYSVIGESLIFKGKPLIAWACCYKAKDAINITSSLLIDKINEIDPHLNMPHYLIGLPNLRGHCFFVPVMVPLFNNKDFVDSLFAAFDIADQHIKEKKLVKPETNLAKIIYKKDAEGLFEALPFLWTRIIKHLYLQYRKASAYGQLYVMNKPRGIEFAYPDIYKDYFKNDANDIPEEEKLEEQDEAMDCSEKLNYKLDIRLDRKLIKLIRELAEFQSDCYRTPGGFANKLYVDIVENLKKDFMGSSSVSPYNDVFYLLFEYEYACIKCGHSGHLKNRVELPAITVPSKHRKFKTIQEILDNPEELTKYDDSVCKEYKFGKFDNSQADFVSEIGNKN